MDGDGDGDKDVGSRLDGLLRRLEEARPTTVGFPGASDFDYTALLPFFGHELNNIGDPFTDPVFAHHSKDLEREVVAFFADLFRAPREDRWGYVTTGGTEGNIEGLYLARTLHPAGLVYRSEATHYSAEKALDLLNLDSVTVRADDNGELDYDHLRQLVSRHRHRPAIVFANVGTTMTEAVDDVRRIKAVLSEPKMPVHYVHADAALAGIPLGLLEPRRRPGFDLADGADSVCVSGHKFIGSPFPCGVFVARASHRDRVARAVAYTGSPDTTITGSRSGHAPLLLWYAIRRYGVAGWTERAERARDLARYAVARLNAIGWEAWRNDHAFTVVLKTPPRHVTARWTLATSGGWSHLVCMPGVTRQQVDRFVGDLAGQSDDPTADAVQPSAHASGPASGQPSGQSEIPHQRRRGVNAAAA